MSQREFENYLALLTGLLQLGRSRQQQIASELRDHLEDRLHDLQQSGLPRDEAVRQAIAEFGDAAGLADELTNVIRQQRRRWVMRTTIRSALVLASVLVLAAAFWPHAGPRLGAQAPTSRRPRGRSQAKPVVKAGSQSTGKAAARVMTDEEKNSLATREKLAHRISVHMADTKLGEALQQLLDSASVQWHVAQAATQPSLLSAEVNIKLEARIDMLLDLALRPNGLDYVIRDGIVLVSTAEEMLRSAEVRIYNCRDLLGMQAAGITPPGMSGMGGGGMGMDGAMGGGGMGMDGGGAMEDDGGYGGYGGEMEGGYGGGMSNSSPLVHLIMQTVAPETWGPNSAKINEFRGLLVIKQHAKAHDQIAQLLEMLREANDSSPGYASQRALSPSLGPPVKKRGAGMGMGMMGGMDGGYGSGGLGGGAGAPGLGGSGH